MHRHTIDPLSAALGVVAAATGLLTAAGRADSIADNPTWGLAVVAILIGVALIPWTRRSAPRRSADSFIAGDGDNAVVGAMRQPDGQTEEAQ
jgi:hypothetical protein